MNHRIRASVLAGVGASLIASCAHLPQGYPSRTGHGQAKHQGNSESESLFVETGTQVAGNSEALESLNNAPMKGLRVRQSKRGNMDSYVVRGQRYFTMDSSDGYSAKGLASWYGPNFHGRIASNGEVYDMYRLTAAHKTLPLPTFARVTHLDSGKSIVVKINDRGPFSGDRLIDLSFAAALELGMVNDGTAMVEIKALSPQELMVLSGPKNQLGVDFYYDHNEQLANRSNQAVDTLFVNDRVTTDVTVAPSVSEAVAVPANDSLTAVALPEGQSEGVVVASANTDYEPVLPMVTDPTADDAAGAVVDISGLESQYLQVVVPGRTRLQEETTGQDIFTGENITVEDVVKEETLISSDSDAPVSVIGDAHKVAVSLVDTAALPTLPANGVPALVKAESQVQGSAVTSEPVQSDGLKLRYYLQAGVFANVNDAERVATNIVLEIPREEVHVKPLKDSLMYRVTVGPIVNKEHASDVASKLHTAGIENYTVKVNES